MPFINYLVKCYKFPVLNEFDFIMKKLLLKYNGLNQSKSTFGIKVLLLILITASMQGTSYSQGIRGIDENRILGFSFFEKIIGQWEGPVNSSTPAGNFDVWYVDFRPVSASQVSQYSNMDANTVNYTSFFIVKHNEKLKIAMRTEGVFMNKGCVTYEVLDSVSEVNGYYRFSDFQSGEKRAYTEFIFKDDKLTMQTFTNKFNKEQKLSLHSVWEAKLASRKAADKAKEFFGCPKPIMVKDFTNAFKNMKESIFFTFENDPYPSDPQPYVGSVTVNIEIDNFELKEEHELFIVLSTESVFEGLKFKKENLKYFSKYAFIPAYTKSFTFTNVHPGKYYLYSYNDVNGDKKHKSGDYMSSDINNIIEVISNDKITAETIIDLKIP